MSKQRSIKFTNWTNGEAQADITVWPLSASRHRHAELDGRMTIGIWTGACNVQFAPTAAEARSLIEALQWALDTEEVAI